MSLTLVTAPAVEPLSLQEAKDHARVTNNVEDALIDQLIVAMSRHIDGKDGWLGRALITQTWDLTFDGFPGHRSLEHGYTGSYFAGDAIRVPLPPLQSVTSITYMDTAGSSQTLAASKYKVDTGSQPGRIVPAFGESWPSTRAEINAVTVRFIAGYGTNPADVPAEIRWALNIMVKHGYDEGRDMVVVGQSVVEMPFSAEALLAPFQVWM